MLIALPVEENKTETMLCPSFGRAPYFMVQDTETGKTDFLENSAAASPGGAGPKAAQQLVDSKVEAVLTPRCGENAAEVLQAAGIKVFKTLALPAEENIRLFKGNTLKKMESFHKGFHGHG